jgi:hypothetical protein
MKEEPGQTAIGPRSSEKTPSGQKIETFCSVAPGEYVPPSYAPALPCPGPEAPILKMEMLKANCL